MLFSQHQARKIHLSMHEAADMLLDVRLCNWRTCLHIANQHVETAFA